MGAYVADSDSELVHEKAQTITPKQSYCPFVLFKKYRRDRREKREQQKRLPEIEEIREQVNKSRTKIKLCQEIPWQRTTSTEERRRYWVNGMETGTFIHSISTYTFGQKYKLTWKGSRRERTVIHDLRTPEGCEKAFKWWDNQHARQKKVLAIYLSLCDEFESLYQHYIKEYDSSTRDLLLLGDLTRWTHIKVEILTN